MKTPETAIPTSVIAVMNIIMLHVNAVAGSSGRVMPVIHDKSSRNITAGATTDFLLGDYIQQEYALSEYFTEERDRIQCDPSVRRLFNLKFYIVCNSQL